MGLNSDDLGIAFPRWCVFCHCSAELNLDNSLPPIKLPLESDAVHACNIVLSNVTWQFRVMCDAQKVFLEDASANTGWPLYLDLPVIVSNDKLIWRSFCTGLPL